MGRKRKYGLQKLGDYAKKKKRNSLVSASVRWCWKIDRYAGPQFPHFELDPMTCDNDNFFDCPNADEPGSPSIHSRESILSDLSEGHELPSEEKSLMEILKKAKYASSSSLCSNRSHDSESFAGSGDDNAAMSMELDVEESFREVQTSANASWNGSKNLLDLPLWLLYGHRLACNQPSHPPVSSQTNPASPLSLPSPPAPPSQSPTWVTHLWQIWTLSHALMPPFRMKAVLSPLRLLKTHAWLWQTSRKF